MDLTKTPLFNGVGAESIGVFLEHCSSIEIPPQHTLLSPEKSGRELYIVLEGQLSVYLRQSQMTALTEVGPGDCVGEMSIIEQASASAWVVAKTRCTLLVIDQSTLWNMIESSHGIARNLLIILSQRLRFDNLHIVNSDNIVRQYQRNSVTDALTELHNRHWMTEHFDRNIDRAKTAATQLCLAMIDLDNFKQFNDQYGHQRGDVILQSVAATLRDSFRPNDLITRFGGDEFAVLMPDTSIEQALLIGERVRNAIQSRLLFMINSNHDVTASIGVAELAKADSLSMLLDRADAAMFRAKKNGRNQVSR